MIARKPAALAGLALLASLTLTGCDDGPECLDYETSTTMGTTIVNGKVRTVPVTSTVCVRYEEER